MHELSIVMSIVDQVQNEVQKLDAKTVKRIELEIGTMAGIEFDSFDFAWGPATKNTVLEKAERVINHKKAIAVCIDCENEFVKNEPYDSCPKCGNFLHQLRSGKELKIKSILIE